MIENIVIQNEEVFDKSASDYSADDLNITFAPDATSATISNLGINDKIIFSEGSNVTYTQLSDGVQVSSGSLSVNLVGLDAQNLNLIYLGTVDDCALDVLTDKTLSVKNVNDFTIADRNTFPFKNVNYIISDAPIVIDSFEADDSIQFEGFNFSNVIFEKSEDENDLIIKNRAQDGETLATVKDYFAKANDERIRDFVVNNNHYNLEWRESNVAGIGEGMYNITSNDSPNLVDGIKNWIDGDSSNGVTIKGKDEFDMLAGTSKNDIIYASKNGSELYGDSGDDIIYGSKGNDFIVGGIGNDEIHLEGEFKGGFNNILCINTPPQDALSFGKDTVYGASINDTLRFVVDLGTEIKGYQAKNLNFVKVGTSLEIIASINNKVTIKDYFDKNGKVASNAVDTIVALNGNNEIATYSISTLMSKNKINLDEYDFEDLTFIRDLTQENSNDLMIVANGEHIVHIERNFFKSKNPVDTVMTKSGTASIRNDASIVVETNDINSYAGSAFNETVSATERNEKFNLKTGEDTIKFSGSIGKNTIIVNKNEFITLDFDYTKGSTETSVSGNDVIVKYTDNNDGTLLGQAIIKDFALKDKKMSTVYMTTATGDKADLEAIKYNPTKYANKLVGSRLDELYFSTIEDETFDLKTGEDTVAYSVEKTGLAGWGNDKIKLTNNEVLTMAISEYYTLNAGGNEYLYSITNDYAVSGKDILITSTAAYTGGDVLPSGYKEEYRLGTIRLLDAASKITGAVIYLNNKELSVNSVLDYSAENVSKGILVGSQLADTVDLSSYVSLDGKGVNVNTKAGDDTITGSRYNDTIKTLKGDNTINESKGKNIIKTGNGFDRFDLDGTSSNTVNTGKGTKIFQLASEGINKVTCLDSDNFITAKSGYNTVNLGNGSNIVSLQGGINKISSGKKADGYNISTAASSNNTINSGAGADIIVVQEDAVNSYNTINAGAGKNQITLNAGVNIVKSGKSADTYAITSGHNTISSGAGNDIFNISGGDSVINGSSGNDIYNVDISSFTDNLMITDAKGANILNLGEDNTDRVNIFFNVKVNKKGAVVYNSMKFSADDATALEIGEETFNDLNGVNVSNKNAISKLTYGGNTYQIKTKELDKLASDIAAWLNKNSDYNSVNDVFSKGNTSDIAKVVGAYVSFADNNYVFDKSNSLLN